MDAGAKATRQGEAIIERTDEMLRARNYGPWRATHIDTLGAETTYGAHARTTDTREVVCKVTVEHEDKSALDVFNREFFSPMTSMSVGTTGWPAGRPTISPIIRLFSFPIIKAEVKANIDLGGDTREVATADLGGFDLANVERPNLADDADLSRETKRVRLIDLAWGRSGDKGDKFNVGIIARKPEYYPFIRKALNEARVMDWFKHEFARDREERPDITPNPRVERFEVPGSYALNFLCHEALGGGGITTATRAIEQLLGRWVEASNTQRTFLWVTHDEGQADRVARRTLKMRQGRIVEQSET